MVVAIATLAMASLAGCASETDGNNVGKTKDSFEETPVASDQVTPEATDKKDVRLEWRGEFQADGFLCRPGGCLDQAIAADKPHNHVRWYEVTLDGLPSDAALSLTWKVRSGTAPEMQVRLECFEATEARCASYEVPSAQGRQAPVELDVPHLAPDPSDVLQVYVGVVPVQTPSGDYYPAVDVTFHATATFGLR